MIPFQRALVYEKSVVENDVPKKGRLSLIKFPAPPARRSLQEDNELEEEEEVFSPSVQSPDPVDTEYDAEQVLMTLQAEYDEKHNPQRKGKRAQFVEWSDEDGDQISSESLNSSEHDTTTNVSTEKAKGVEADIGSDIDPDIDAEYDWNASMTKVKAKASALSQEADGDSLHESEDEVETPLSERRRQHEVAQYQSAVYGNEQPMHQIHRKESARAQRQSLHSEPSQDSQQQWRQCPLSPPSERRIIDWDEDDFEGDSLSDESTEDDDEKEYIPKTTPSTKQEYHSYHVMAAMNGQQVSFKEERFMNNSHFTLRLYHSLEEYVHWVPGGGGKGVRIQKVARNKHGKKLYIKYGFEGQEKWFVDSINGQSVTKTLRKDIDALLKAVDLQKGYTVTLKKTVTSNVKKKGHKKHSGKNTKSKGKSGSAKSATKPKSSKSSTTKRTRSPESRSSVKAQSRSSKSVKSVKSPKSPSTSKKSTTKSPKSVRSSTSSISSRSASAKSPKSKSSVKRKNGKMQNGKVKSPSNSKTKKKDKERQSKSAKNGMNGKVMRQRKVLKV